MVLSEKEILNLLIGKLIKKGKRAKAEKVVLNCLKDLEQKEGQPGQEVFLEALDNIIPLVEIKSKKVGGTVYRIPIEVNQKRGLSLAIGWLLDNVRKQERGTLSERLCNELLLARKGQGKTVEKVRELHTFAQKNRGLVKFL